MRLLLQFLRRLQVVVQGWQRLLCESPGSVRFPSFVAFATLMLGGAVAIGSRLGAEFLPRLEEGALTVTTTKLPGISLESAIATQSMIEKTLMKFPEVECAVSLGDSSEIPTDRWGSSKATRLSFSSRNRNDARPRARPG